MSKPNNQPTARNQFVQDISLVLDNDHESYELIQNKAKELMQQEEFINSANWLLATFIKDYVENAIDEMENIQKILKIKIYSRHFLNYYNNTYS